MPATNSQDFKERIISIIKRRGPSLPVHIAKEISLSILFTSAFLSELIAEKEIKISEMRVGNSPVYYIEGQEPNLEKFSQYLGSKEKEAFNLLRQRRFLRDKELEPAIRVALREIRDFAIAFKKDEEIFWRYYTVHESEFIEEKQTPPQKQPEVKETAPEPTKEIEEEKETISKKPKPKKTRELNIFEKPIKKKEEKTTKKKVSKKQNETFFNKVKEILSKRSIEISDIVSFNKNELILRVKDNNKEELVIAYNKKRITEEDLIKASKKASELNFSYTILSLGEIPRKLKDLLIAVENLSKIEKLE
ncbi:MAG: hypothetical protein Q8P15_03730 [Nanoarchaeota archaeon]|nr:hypothetical protein [Nanoarchaeota archaeon]